jgi:hypothetical protein
MLDADALGALADEAVLAPTAPRVDAKVSASRWTST